MQNSSKKYFALVAIALICGFSFAGCANRQESSVPEAETVVVDSPVTTEAPILEEPEETTTTVVTTTEATTTTSVVTTTTTVASTTTTLETTETTPISSDTESTTESTLESVEASEASETSVTTVSAPLVTSATTLEPVVCTSMAVTTPFVPVALPEETTVVETSVTMAEEETSVASDVSDVETSETVSDAVVTEKAPETGVTANGTVIPRKVMLDVKNVSQRPELPAGCEITSTTIALRYYGFQCTKLEMVNYLPMAQAPGSDGRWITPWEGFVGNPRFSYYGCYSPVIIEAINNYWKAQKVTGYRVDDLSGSDITDLYAEVAAGNPVIIWAGTYMCNIRTNRNGWTVQDGSWFKWTTGEHCVVLMGYDLDNDTVTISDPWDYKGTVTYARSTVQHPYDQLEKQALVIHKDTQS